MNAIEKLLATAAALSQKSLETQASAPARAMRDAAETIREAVASLRRTAEGEAARAMKGRQAQ
jgi:hypothetical protein